jgi:hypothetical protein
VELEEVMSTSADYADYRRAAKRYKEGKLAREDGSTDSDITRMRSERDYAKIAERIWMKVRPFAELASKVIARSNRDRKRAVGT